MRNYRNRYIGQTLRSNYPLTDSQMMGVAPSIFAESEHDSCSERYTFIPTIEIIKALKGEGFYPYSVGQSRSRIPGKEEFTKHMIRFRKQDCISNLEVNQELGEIILINSHDRTSSYQMRAGIYRLVCTNGLVTGDDFEDYKVHHKGDIKDNVIEVAYRITNELNNVKEDVEEMKSIELKREEQELFAQSALVIKYDDKEEAPIQASSLLRNRRIEDNKNDIWTVFNKTQENIIKGGLPARTKTGRRTTTKEIKSIDNNIRLNKALWNLASGMAKLKEQMRTEILAELKG